jgi:hypothetical protein
MKQHDRTHHLLSEIKSAQSVIERNTYTGSSRNAYLVGVLSATLKGMAGLGEHTLHASCFDPETTEAIAKLLETINQE